MSIDWKAIAGKFGFNNDKEMFRYYYEEENMASRSIASLIKVGRDAILRRLEKVGIKVKSRGGRNNLNPMTDKFEEEILMHKHRDLANMTSEDIIQAFNIPKSIFYKIAAKHNIRYKKYCQNERKST